MNVKKGEIIELEIEKYAFEGRGIAKVDKGSIVPESIDESKNKYVIFVDGAYPGDIVKASLTKIKKSYAEARVSEIIKPSDLRIPARCKFFGTCGGCKQQDLDYATQTKFKQQQVEEIFTRMGGFKDFITEDILPSEKVFFYRNKMEFSFAEKRWLTVEEIKSDENIERDFALGLHIPRVFDKVLDIDECFLQSELSNKILNFTRNFFKEKETTIYSTKTHEGFLRNLVIKQSHHTKDLMVNLVTSSENKDLMNLYTDELLKEIPQITTIINNVNLRKASVAVGDYEKIFCGNGFIHDTIGKHKFRISANSFFQTNSLQAEKLYQTALDFAEMKGNEIVYDLYSGAGTISIFVSDFCKEVYAFETVQSAISDAEENAKLNNVENVPFITADLYKSFYPLVEEKKLPKPGIIILDPPRSGMHKNTVEDVIKLNPEKLVYVSCNPVTQVRDIKLFSEAGYKLVKIKPVDMFPHTYHIENVALLIKV
ncbi:MAG TPA: 23S rRNA (uracil(1939)-C(5))-methyltransferase RlmD [Ignavibacteriaceae bacterium]|nr:23S rRNA (uracil(1939)-C(5))-methyltransferase RlmD [Ignavibacteriaceae bacterium]